MDTSILVPLLRFNEKDKQAIEHRLVEKQTESPVSVSVAALAELHTGARRHGADANEARRVIDELLQKYNLMIREITKKTAAEYGRLKARFMEKYGRKRRKGKWPEKWDLPDTGATLGVDEFDLLMVTHALEYNLVLVTREAMGRIREGVGEAAADLQLEDWTQSPSI